MTATVTIIPVTAELLDLEEDNLAILAAALDAAEPPEWPPEFNGEAYCDWQRGLLAQHPDDRGWAGYYVVGDGELVGTCGFKGPPDGAGIVEIGYSIIAPRRRRGFASAAVMSLVDLAFADARVKAVAAETLSDGIASQSVVRRCGFQRAGARLDAEDGEVVRFERRRPA